MKRSEIVFSLLHIPLDLLMIVMAGIVAYLLRFSYLVSSRWPILFVLPFTQYVNFLFTVGSFSLIFFAFSGLYQLKATRSLVHELFLVIVAVTSGVVTLALWLFVVAQPFESRLIIFFWWMLSIFFVALARIIVKKFQQYLVTRYGIGLHRVLLIGHPNPGSSPRFASLLSNNPAFGYAVVEELTTLDLGRVHTLVSQHAVDDIFLTDLAFKEEDVFDLVRFAHRMQISFSFIPSLFTSFRTELHPLAAGLALLEVKHTPLEGWGKLIKRTVDIAGALVGLLVLLAVLPFVALAIRLESAGPIIIGLKRVREGGQAFTLYKFRSMIKNAHELKFTVLKHKNERKHSPLFKIKDDPRITRLGRFLRRFRIDELPNFINVLQGEMSLVGPRPHEPEEVERYKKHHLQVLSIKPGVTGLAQISGSSDLPFDREVELDTYYIGHWSLILDLSILIRTITFVFTDKSAV